jgi:small-conductance mechanosensitive channel
MYAIHARIPGMLREKGIEMTYPHLNVHIQQ